ncbi:ATP-binding protein [Paenibacillus oleatilyticus]|uniref:ATP-binding protein n=1 Tax=Paenibacillus oleatilyticus TaxID=2594886 RepID=A0ABV4VCC9_9BACL
MDRSSIKSSSTPSLYECSLCKDEGGYIQPLRDEFGEIVYDEYTDESGNVKARKAREGWAFCSCIQTKKIQMLFKSSQITDQMRQKGFKNFDVTSAPQAIVDAKDKAIAYYKAFKEIRNDRRNSIALVGQPGSGKTHLLMAIANTLLHFGTQVIYFSWVDGFDDLKDNLDKTKEMIYRLQNAEVLFIDDMFKGRKELTDFERRTLFAIINHRYLNHLPILVSSERDTDMMCDLDEAIGSRIHEMCRDYMVVLSGRELNYRLRGESA